MRVVDGLCSILFKISYVTIITIKKSTAYMIVLVKSRTRKMSNKRKEPIVKIVKLMRGV